MKGKTLLIVNAVLLIVAVLIAVKIYQVVMEPIEFERKKMRIFCQIYDRIEQVREAELAYKTEFGEYTGDFDVLSAFVDTGRVTIMERKDSSFMYYNKRFQKDMNKDTIIVRVIGYQEVKELFPSGFKGEMLRQVPGTDGAEFELAAGEIQRNGAKVPVFEVSVADEVALDGLRRRFDRYVDREHKIQIGSLTEASISGNYEKTDCKNGNN